MVNQIQEDPIRHQIVIADDHALVRGGLELVVKMAVPNADIFQTNSFEDTIKILSENSSIDLLLLDLMMPGMDGEKSIFNISNIYPSVPIVIVSVKEDFDSIHMAISSGASGYIPKTSLPEVTISAINLVLAGGVYIPPHVLKSRIGTNTDSSSPESNIINKPKILSKRQEEVINLIKIGKSNQSIATELDLTIPTIKMHVSAIFKKLDAKNRTEAVAKYSDTQKVSDLIT
jgi:DNA-binding NarL/FixJ family response regulator